jgi:hypothetical protein
MKAASTPFMEEIIKSEKSGKPNNVKIYQQAVADAACRAFQEAGWEVELHNIDDWCQGSCWQIVVCV